MAYIAVSTKVALDIYLRKRKVLYLVLLYLYIHRRHKRRRRFWMHPILRRRKKLGRYNGQTFRLTACDLNIDDSPSMASGIQPLPTSPVFLRHFRKGNWVPSFENCVPRISENYHQVPRIGENRVSRIREIGSLQVHTG